MNMIIALIVLLFFIVITNYMKLAGIRILKSGKVHGIFIIMTVKVLFWLTILELVYMWAPKIMIVALPTVFIVFLIYVFLEKNLFYQLARKKEETPNE